MTEERRPDGLERGDLRRDRSFLAYVFTQFLGAFNDNVFKQTILLLAVLQTGQQSADDLQPLATGLFALPFLLFSGFAGSLSDRYSKTRIIWWCKVAEIGVMILGGIGFFLGSLPVLLGVLFLMGAQSAFFGPAKYGALPEMLETRHLARANGIVLMTTFLAIILGQAFAGLLKDHLQDELYLGSIVYVGLAVLGTRTAQSIRFMEPARPTLRLAGRPFGDLWLSARHIVRDRSLFWVVFAYGHFWFLGGCVQQFLNFYGLKVLELSNTETSLLLVTLSAGIASGSALGGALSRNRIRLSITWIGLAGISLGLAGLCVAAPSVTGSHAVLFLLGASAGMFGVPLQAFIQFRSPEGEKGRVFAAVNFITWIFIFLSAGYYGLITKGLATSDAARVPASLLIVTAALAILWIRPLVRVARELNAQDVDGLPRAPR
ncbi:MAG: MFS transporter [Planctomycetes bacterium]|nr:MFS transporter [Planctomycetota bacterium]